MNDKDFINWLSGFLDSKEVLSSDLEKIKLKLSSIYISDTGWPTYKLTGYENWSGKIPQQTISPNQVQISC